MVRSGARFIKTHIALAVTSCCFLAIQTMFIAELIQQSPVIFSGEFADAVWRTRDQKQYIVITILMSFSGFAMMVLLIGGLIDLLRAQKERTASYEVVRGQMAAIENARDGIAILDASGRYTYMNAAHASCYGFEDRTHLIGRSWKDLYEPAVIAQFEKDVFPTLDEHGWFGTSTGRRADGTSFPQEVSLSLLPDGGLICVVRDITDKVKREEMLEMIRLAVEAADDGIAITDMNNRILFSNCSFLRLHGIDLASRDAVIGSDWRNVYNMEGRGQINSLVLPTAILKGSWAGTIKIMSQDKSVFHADASLTKVGDRFLLGVIRDASERHRAEREREMLQEQLFQTRKTEAISRLTGGIAVDFETLLDEMRTALDQLAAEGAARGSAISTIERSYKSARELVDQLLAFSQKRTTRAQIVDVEQSVRRFFTGYFADPPPELDCVLDIKMHGRKIQANPEQLDQIMACLCRNAQEALGQKRGKISISVKDADRSVLNLNRFMIAETPPDRTAASQIRLRQTSTHHVLMTGYLRKDRAYIHMTIADTGCGIAPEILPHIFDPFFTTGRHEKSPGLGLSFVHGVVIGMGGAIIIESKIGEGTSVHIFLPRAEREIDTEEARPQTATG